MFNNDTYSSGHIQLGLGCHVYVDAKSKVISDLIKCELLTTVGRIDAWIGFDWICFTTTHNLQGIFDLG